MRLSDVAIVLSRPMEAGNVGAVCRAMKNMGLSRLRLAAPAFKAPGAFLGDSLQSLAKVEAMAGGELAGFAESAEAGPGFGGNLAIIKARAIHALDVWENAETFDTLAEAVKGCSLVIGATRRRGRHRKQVTMTPAELAAFLKNRPGPAALVFGNERAGLEDDELEICNVASHIPVDEAFPSLNLSHAVQIYAYELFRNLAAPAADDVKGQWEPLDQEAIERLVGELADTLKSLGFYKRRGREEQERFLRDLIARAALTQREGIYFAGIIAKAARLAAKNE